ncbi:MAG TPA: hypothetical protein VMM12_05465 [Longimicrobiales bacterium]|nr:hypothetical protein [Longimicrobiales bacterium]
MASVIAARAGEAGGKVGRESPGDLARRFAEKKRREGERGRRQSTEGRAQTEEEMERLLKELKRHAEEITEAWHPMVVEEENALRFSVVFQGQNLHFFHRPTGNTLREAELVAQLTRRGQRGHTTWTYRLELDENDVWCWRNTDVDDHPGGPVVILNVRTDELQTTPELAEGFARKLVQWATK